MAQKYTILKVLIRNLNRAKNSSQGFTLLELLVGLVIMSIVIGLSLNAFNQASSDFNKDKKNIESGQNLTAVLQMIGNDIQQAGEQITDNRFPVVEFSTSGANTPSTITIRRAVSTPLTLCQVLDNTTTVSSLTELTVANNTLTENNCKVGTSTTPLLVSRPNTTYTIPTTPPISDPTTALSPLVTSSLRELRDYRCKQDNPNPSTPYDDDSQATVDFCNITPPTPNPETLRIAVTGTNGRILIFNQTNENDKTGANVADRRYTISVNTNFVSTPIADPAIASNTANAPTAALPYNIGSPIYAIEERTYTLDTTNGTLKLSVNGGAAQDLISNIDKFSVSAKIYQDTTAVPLSQQQIDPAPSNACVSGTNSQFASDSAYTCRFNAGANWRTLAGVQVQIQAKYNSTGGSSTATAEQLEKLTARAEFFPRNVLSK